MKHSGSAEHGMKQQGVMGVGWWALRRVCGLGGPQGGRTRDAQGRRCGGIAPWIALGQYGKNNYDPRGACGSNKRGLRFIALGQKWLMGPFNAIFTGVFALGAHSRC